MTSRRLQCVATLTLLVILAVQGFGQSGRCELTKQDKAVAVQFVRLINTAEADYFAVHQNYVDLTKLIVSPEFAKTRSDTMFSDVKINPTAENLGQPFSVAFVTDGQKYALTVTWKGCTSGFVSTPSGLIYEMEALR